MSGSAAGVFSRRRAGLVAALALAACGPGRSPAPAPSATTTTPAPAEVALRGAFESGSIVGARAGVALRGHLAWNGAIAGSRGGVTLRGALAPE